MMPLPLNESSALQPSSSCQSDAITPSYETLLPILHRHDDDHPNEPKANGHSSNSNNTSKWHWNLWKRSNSTPEKQADKNNNNKIQADTDSFWLDRDALHFGVRMALCITVSSLAVLLQTPRQATIEQPMWLVITVLFICWFPELDAASVVEKSIQRLYGTAIGAVTGLLVGFVSLYILGEDQSTDGEKTTTSASKAAQSAFLGCCIGLYTFLICTAAVQLRVPNAPRTKIITKYNYACILSLLTFYICVLPFHSSEELPRWRKANWRVVNVLAGCILGAALSILILPRSTARIVRHKMEVVIQLAGEASEAVLYSAAESFSDSVYVAPRTTNNKNHQGRRRRDYHRQPSSVRECIKESKRHWRKNQTAVSNTDDLLALEKYESAIKEWKNIQTQLGKLRYDPFNLGTPDLLLTSFRTEMANALARTLRIHNTVVLLDGIVRNDPKHDFNVLQIGSFARVGHLIRTMLTVPLRLETNQQACRQLKAELAQIRSYIVDLAAVVAKSSREQMPEIVKSSLDLAGMDEELDEELDINNDENPATTRDWSESQPTTEQYDDQGGLGAPKFVHGSRVCALLFLQLVEHLVLRSVRLYDSWKQCERICDAYEKRDEAGHAQNTSNETMSQ